MQLKVRGAEWEKAVYRLPDYVLLIELAGKYRIEPGEVAFMLPGEISRYAAGADIKMLAGCYGMLMDNLDERTAKNNGTMDKIVQHEKISLKDKMKQITKMLTGKISLLFSDIFPHKKSTKGEIITGFLAMLELSRLRKILIEQRKQFSEIFIYRYRSNK